MSGSSSPSLILGDFEKDVSKPQIQVLTEGAIYEAVLKLINTAKPKEHLDLSMFYLSERKIIKALKVPKNVALLFVFYSIQIKMRLVDKRMVSQTVR